MRSLRVLRFSRQTDTIERHNLCPHRDIFIASGIDHQEVDAIYHPNQFTDEIGSELSQDIEGDDDKAQERKRFLDWSRDELAIYLCGDHVLDPFYHSATSHNVIETHRDDDLLVLERDDVAAEIMLGQLAIYAKQAFDHQHRTHLFQLLICGTERVRFLYWDRSGIIVTRPFDISEDPMLLVEFLWRFSYMPSAARGLDSSARLSDSQETETFQTAVKKFLTNMKDPEHPQRELPRAEDTLSDQFPVSNITVTDSVTDRAMDLLVQGPFNRSPGILGKNTRAYVALAVETGELMFFKDQWRKVYQQPVEERLTYACLNDSRVANVPIVTSGGDVQCNGEDAGSECWRWCEEGGEDIQEDTMNAIRLVKHSRLVQELTYPLSSAAMSRELVTVLRDCAEGALSRMILKFPMNSITFTSHSRG